MGISRTQYLRIWLVLYYLFCSHSCICTYNTNIKKHKQNGEGFETKT